LSYSEKFHIHYHRIVRVYHCSRRTENRYWLCFESSATYDISADHTTYFTLDSFMLANVLRTTIQTYNDHRQAHSIHSNTEL